MKKTNPYQPGGALQGDSYIPRLADDELKEAISSNVLFPYFLAARQSGKSSILARMQSILSAPELHIAIVDLSAFAPDSLSSYEAFVSTLIDEVLSELPISDPIRQKISKLKKRPRFLLEAIRMILAQVSGRLVICLDEVDVLTPYDFKDIFLGQIRALFNSRTREPALTQIQFVLAGAASPEELIADLRQSPFNVGKEIRLDDLSSDGITRLLLLGWPADTFGLDEANRRLMEWTSGSVFLCQEILHRCYDAFYEALAADRLPQVIERTIVQVIEESVSMVHFRNIDHLLRAQPTLLNRWRRWTMGSAPTRGVIDDLTIIGISGPFAPFRNRIYQRVFGQRGPLSLLPAFSHDVFIGHSASDKELVRRIAEKLRRDGLNVWFDEWELKPGDNIRLKIEEGLEHSRVLVLCISRNALGKEWAQLETESFRFRDPLNTERRFIPLRLDESPVEGTLAQFNHIAWSGTDEEREYARLLDACRPRVEAATWEVPSRSSHSQEGFVQLSTKTRLSRHTDGEHQADSIMTRAPLSVFEEVLHDLAVAKAIPQHLANVRVTRDLTLQDLGLDSVDVMVIIAELEKRLGTTFPEHQDPPSTIKDVLSWIDSPESFSLEYRGENFGLADVIIRGRRLPLNDRLERCSDLIASVSREYAQTFTRLIEPPLDREVTVRDAEGHVRRMLMFGSNNYLGLANHPTVIAAVKAAITKYGVGVGGAALLSGYTILHAELEDRLAAMKAAEDAVLFPSGYGAIVGVTAALAGSHDVVYYDQYSHASTADGLKMAKCKAIRFRHNDPASLREAIETQSDHKEQYVAVEGVYSMDGDIAPLDQILNVCNATGARLILDDSHGTAVLGKSGRGTAEHFGVEGMVDVTIGTLSKAFAVTGAFAAAPKPVTTYLRYMAPSHMFSSALPVMTVAAVLAGLDVLENECERLAKLHDNVRYLNKGFEALGIPCRSETPIFVLRVPTKVNMRAAAHRFHERGIFVNAVEYPAVARNEQRFRFSLMATHTQQDLNELLSTTDDVWRNLLNSQIRNVGKS